VNRNSSSAHSEPFRLKDEWRRIPAVGGAFVDLADKALCLDRLRCLYHAVTPSQSPSEFASRVLAALRVRFVTDGDVMTRLPRSGPAVECVVLYVDATDVAA
jgi:hypothetical protein